MTKSKWSASLRIVAAGVFSLALLGLPAVANATTEQNEGIIELGPGVTTSSPAGEAAIDAALSDLQGTQTQAEIDSLVDLGNATVLYDLESGVDLAAISIAPKPGPLGRAITVVGPGCSSTSMCLTNKNPNGFAGSGTRSVNLSGVTKAFAGDRIGSITPSSGPVKVMAKGVTLKFASPGTVVFITRG
ncbi:hypothetical protein ACFWHR_00850 [Leucobacter sp. NPDC058333]|uniref:hypothetical protein n=1 Tax=Leucobacter sp. NPDC058333 TaxID=3346450 RepID=UPI00365BE666